jgi:hypothetical protein
MSTQFLYSGQIFFGGLKQTTKPVQQSLRNNFASRFSKSDATSIRALLGLWKSISAAATLPTSQLIPIAQCRSGFGSAAQGRRRRTRPSLAVTTTGKVMNCQEPIAAMTAQGRLTGLGGLAAHATLYSLILRELKATGAEHGSARSMSGNSRPTKPRSRLANGSPTRPLLPAVSRWRAVGQYRLKRHDVRRRGRSWGRPAGSWQHAPPPRGAAWTAVRPGWPTHESGSDPSRLAI